MKKFIYLFAFCFLLSAFSLNAQTTQYHFPEDEAGFEKGWVKHSSPIPGHGDYWEFETNWFYTLNSLYCVENSELTAFRGTFMDGDNPQNGQYCIRLTSGQIAVQPDYVFLPGMVGTISEEFVKEFLDAQSGVGEGVKIYRPWEFQTPHALEGWFKYKPVNGDSALIDIGFYNADKEVFVAKKIIKETVNDWRKFSISIPEKYWNEVFDDIRILFVASAGVNFVRLDSCKGRLGSTLWIDNIKLDYSPAGIKQNLFSTLKANAFPNPATEVLHIELNENFNGKITVYSLSGSLISEESIKGTQHTLNTSALATGNYIFRLMKENTIFAQGKFVVTK